MAGLALGPRKHIARKRDFAQNAKNLKTSLEQRAMAFIAEHIQRPISVGEVAQRWRKRQLRRLFRKQFGKGIVEDY